MYRVTLNNALDYALTHYIGPLTVVRSSVNPIAQ